MIDKVYFTVGDATYAYEVIGDGNPIVLLHGFTSNRSTWTEFIATWKSDYKLITVDLPGHGDTKVNSIKSMEDCCHDLAKLFKHLGISSFHLVGYSMGGRTALSFAMFYPELILSLTLESSSPGIQSIQEQKERQKQDEHLANRIENEGIKLFVNYWECVPLFESQKNLHNNIKKKIRNERLSQSAYGLVQSLRGMGTGVQPSWWDHLSGLKCPTLLIVGALDQKFVKINKLMNSYMQHSFVEIVNEAGHNVHIEQPAAFNQLVGKFIKTSETNHNKC